MATLANNYKLLDSATLASHRSLPGVSLVGHHNSTICKEGGTAFGPLVL